MHISISGTIRDHAILEKLARAVTEDGLLLRGEPVRPDDLADHLLSSVRSQTPLHLTVPAAHALRTRTACAVSGLDYLFDSSGPGTTYGSREVHSPAIGPEPVRLPLENGLVSAFDVLGLLEKGRPDDAKRRLRLSLDPAAQLAPGLAPSYPLAKTLLTERMAPTAHDETSSEDLPKGP